MRAQVLAAGQLHVPLGGPTRRADAVQPGARAEVQPAPEHAVGSVHEDARAAAGQQSGHGSSAAALLGLACRLRLPSALVFAPAACA